MPNMVQTGLYEEDLHGTNPNNLITTETHTLQVPGVDDYYFIIPRAAPYFVSSLKVFNNQTGTLYKENLDYTIGHRFIDAMDSIGRPIAGSIRFMRRDIVGQVRLEYRTLGGNWGYDDTQILAELSRRQYNPITRVWGNIGPLPYSFPPLIHDQSLDTLVGSEDLNESLVRIADILEATAAGTAADHLKDFGNPHKVTKGQVGLGLVNNYATANEDQTIAGSAGNLYVTPKGLAAALRDVASAPLDDHLQDLDNPHNTTADQVGLGQVSNFPIATAANATDVTRNDLYLTPYTATLLIQRIQEDPRLEQLLVDFNNHLIASNPHSITPRSIGTLTEAEIMDLLSELGGGDASTFGGMLPDEWKDLFPYNDDINGILTAIDIVIDEGGSIVAGVTVPTVGIDEEDPNKITQLKQVWDGYLIGNDLKDNLVFGPYRATTPAGKDMDVAGAKNASYVIDPLSRSVVAFGSNPINLSGIGQASGIWATEDALFWQEYNVDGTGKLSVKTRAGVTSVILQEGVSDIDIKLHPGTNTTKVMAVITYQNSAGGRELLMYGDSSWVTKMNALNTSFSGVDVDYVVGENHVVTSVQNLLGTASKVRVYKINFTGSITLSEITNTLSVRAMDGTLKTLTDLNSQDIPISVNGIKNQFVLTIAESPFFALLDTDAPTNPIWLGELNAKKGYTAVVAGNDYMVTLAKNGYVSFWGNSPDNSLVVPNIRTING